MKYLVRTLALGALLGLATPAAAASISIFTVAGANTYENTQNNPCVFFGPGQSGCNKNPDGWSMVGDTGGGDPFNPNPLVNTYGDAPGELALFGANVGRTFYLGLDINDTSTAQFLTDTTVTFFGVGGTTLGSFTFDAGPLAVPNSNNGEGFADYILSAGCLDLGGAQGSGNTATCTTYRPFSAPAGTTSLTFTFGLTGFNDGPDKLFLISAGPGGVPTPFCTVEPCEPPDDEPPPGVVPEPGSMVLLGTGLFALAGKMRQRMRRG
jgi:hypothetical protein